MPDTESSKTAIPNLGYAGDLKGYARFKSYADLNNIQS